MATMQKNELSFEKPYLGMIRDDILAGKAIDFIIAKTKTEAQKKVSVVIIVDATVKKFIEYVNTGNLSKIERIVKDGGNLKFFLKSKDGEYKWSEIDKTPYSGQGGGNTTATIETVKQEAASLYAIEMSIKKNGFKNKAEFLKVCGKGLRKLYDAIDATWEETFYQQQLTVQREVGSTKFTHYSHSKDFMVDITQYIKNQYGISQKDTWNPADVWLVNNLSKVSKMLFKKIDDTVTNIEEFNRILRELYNSNEVVGISLKKVSGSTALWQNVNVGNDMLEDYSYKYDSSICKLKLKGKNFTTQDSYIFVNSKTEKVKMQIKDNGGNLKIEGTSTSSAKARLGKAPLDMVKLLMKKMGVTLNNNHNTFPKTLEQFEARQKEFVKIFNFLVGKVEMEIKTEKDFVKNISAVFKSKPSSSTTKLMQLSFLYEFYKVKDLDGFSSSLVYLAMKKGDVFGPFGKLY